jgi:hypothetical protein
MPINFPNSPIVNQTFTQGETTWRFNGTAWVVIPAENITLTNLTITGELAVQGTTAGLVQELNDLSDVDVENPLNQQYLRFNSTTGNWEAATITTTFNGGTITNPLVINNSTVTTGATSGALRITGGVGIGDDLFVGGTIIVEDENLEIRARGQVRLFNTDNSRYVGFRAPESISADKIYVLPQTDGSAGQFLRTDGNGTLSWASAAGAGGGTPPGGLDTQVQFNDNNSFGGNASFTFDAENQTLSAPNTEITGLLTITDTTESTDELDGAVQVAGGVGIEKQLNVAGAVNKFTGGTASSSTTTGTIVVTGGMGISGAVNIGATVSADTAPTTADHLTNKRYVDANVLAFSVAFGA